MDDAKVMDEVTAQKLIRRLDGLERRNRWSTLCGVTALVIAAVAVFLAVAPGRTQTVPVAERVLAEKFVLIDKSGLTRAELGLDATDGSTVLQLHSNPGGSLYLTADADGASLQLLGKGRDSAATISALSSSALALQSRNGNAEIALQVPAAEASVGTKALRPRTLAAFSLEKGNPSLTLRDDRVLRAALGRVDIDGRDRIGAGGPRPTSSLVLFDDEGKVIWKAP